MRQFHLENMKKIVDRFVSVKILVLGDLMLDKYIWGEVVRISPEAPVPVVKIQKDTSCLGGAGNVSHNLEKLGSSPIVVGVVGKDPEGEWIRNHLKEKQGVFSLEERPTTVKTRIIAHHQQVVRVDLENKAPVPDEIQEKIFDVIKEEKYDGILISDYNKGIVSKSLMSKVISFAYQHKIPVFVDPKVVNFQFFSPVTLITPNHYEVEQIVLNKCSTNKDVEKAGANILARISTSYLIIKRGEQGMSVFAKGKGALHIPAIAKEIFDVTGAGDTVIATAALALLSGASIQEAAVLANTAAGIVVGKIGTASLSSDELLSQFSS